MAKSESAPFAFHVELSTLALGVAGVTTVAAIAVGLFASVASALLVFVTGALLGSILLVWHSLRTLAGDAEVDPALDAVSPHAPTELAERKRRALRALKDIEQDHAVGKIEDDDFKELDAEYRARAKAVIREMDAVLDPQREKAEAIVRAHLEKRAAERAKERAKPKPARATCPECETANDADATFCKKCGTKLASDDA